MADIHIKGLAELHKFLESLPTKLAKNVVRGGLRAGAKVIQEAARQNVHSVSGQLAAGIKVSTNMRGSVITASIKTRGPHAFLAKFVEYGTAAHFIKVQDEEKPINTRLSKRRGVIVRASMTTVNRNALKIGATFVGPVVHHPGARMRPFLRPALDSKSRDALLAMGEYIKGRLSTKHGLDTSEVSIGDE